MRYFIFYLLTLFVSNQGLAQNPDGDRLDRDLNRDSLKAELLLPHHDTTRIWLMHGLIYTYRFNRPDSAIYYGVQARRLAREINFPVGEVAIIRFMAISYIAMGNYSKAMQLDLDGIKLAEKYGLVQDKIVLLLHVGLIHSELHDYNKALMYLKTSIALGDSTGFNEHQASPHAIIGEVFLKTGQLDSARYYLEKAYHNLQENPTWRVPVARLYASLGKLHHLEGSNDQAHTFFHEGIMATNSQSRRLQFQSNFPAAEFFLAINNRDSSEFYAKKSLDIALEGKLYDFITSACNLLSQIYKKSNLEKSLEFKEMAMVYRDSLARISQQAALQDYIDFDELDRQRELEAARAEYQTELRSYAFSAGLVILMIIAVFLYRDNKAKHKSKRQIEKAYDQLKSTQAQLIQSEKMASLGELTAGVAHEIQNPLNFVNNFSEVNRELIDELQEELKGGKIDDAMLISKDIKANEEKINLHGRRADAIVKSMLQHSRSSSGEKELADINALCDEYLRLAYHGMRARDKSFNAELKTELDPELPKIKVVPQDIGRVLLNLINNAFQAVAEVDKPEVMVTTRRVDSPLGLPDRNQMKAGSGGSAGRIEITVSDNGPGIPDDIRDKIFQPFFTTKPTGEGTGLGLSLAYDIVKSHGGEIRVESKIGKGSKFILHLPTNDRL